MATASIAIWYGQRQQQQSTVAGAAMQAQQADNLWAGHEAEGVLGGQAVWLMAAV
jgi:hypothetical protein